MEIATKPLVKYEVAVKIIVEGASEIAAEQQVAWAIRPEGNSVVLDYKIETITVLSFSDISEVPDKLATTLVRLAPDHEYNRSIHNAANALIAAGMGDWHYLTQWSSGNTLWGKRTSAGEITRIVDVNGNIKE
jgi:hypothetical protein